MTFSALNYLRGIQTYYRVRIKGVPEYDDWRVLAYGKSEDMVDKYGHLRLPLLGLEPGTYEVEVQASFWPDEWPEAPRVWRINVQQPWWRTTGLYLTLTVVLLILFVFNFLAYNTNLRLRMYRNNDEADLLRRIKGFVARCETLASEELSPLANEEEEPQNDRQLDEFVEAMLHIVPFVNDNQERKYHISDLAAVAGVKSEKLYELLTVYIDQSPRHLSLPLRLQQAAQLLTTTNLSVDEIGRQCHFVTTAYFVSSFRQRYGMTPADYRVTMPR
jgi:AraC-like DNA-binding protein